MHPAVVLVGLSLLARLLNADATKRPSVDGLPVWRNGNCPVQEPGDGKKPIAYC